MALFIKLDTIFIKLQQQYMTAWSQQSCHNKAHVYLFRASAVYPVLPMAIKSTGTSSEKATLQIRNESMGCSVGVEIKRKRSVSS